MRPMNPNKIAMLEARRRWHAGLLPAFDEIAQVCLRIVRGAGKISKIFADLQTYLDSAITINGASYRRRSVVLAIHDMTDETEAPATFQSKTLTQFLRLKVYPVPQLRFYQDIATALLKIEVILRLTARQELDKEVSKLALAPARVPYWQNARQWLYSSIETISIESKSFGQTLALGVRAGALSRLVASFVARASTAIHAPQLS